MQIRWTTIAASLFLLTSAPLGCSDGGMTDAGTPPLLGMPMAGGTTVASSGGSSSQVVGSQGGAPATGTMPTGTATTTGTTGTTTTGTATTGTMTTTGTTGTTTTTGTTGTTTGSTGSLTITGTTGTVAGAGTGAGGMPTTNPSTGGATTMAGASTGGAGEVNLCDSTLSGQEFYMLEGACVTCHGTEAQGIPNLGPEARHVDEDYAAWIIRNGRSDHADFPAGMTPYEPECVTDTMIDELIAFLNGFPKPTDGEALYVDYCANCHGEDGLGGVTMRSLAGELDHIDDLTSGGHSLTTLDDRMEYMPVFTNALLTQAEIDLIATYLEGLVGNAGGQFGF